MAPAIVKHIRWRFVLVLVLVPVLLLATSCTALMRGTSQGIPFNSTPPGAEIYLDGELVGVTPTTVTLWRAGTYTLLLRMGDQEREVIVSNSVSIEGGALLALDVAPGGAVAVLGAVELARCSPGFLSGMCQGISTQVLLAGVATAVLPLVIDVATGAIFELSPGEVFIDFEVQEEATSN